MNDEPIDLVTTVQYILAGLTQDTAVPLTDAYLHDVAVELVHLVQTF